MKDYIIAPYILAFVTIIFFFALGIAVGIELFPHGSLIYYSTIQN